MKFAFPFSARIRALAMAGAVLAATAAMPLAASAHFMGWSGGHWAHSPGVGTHVPYSRGCAGQFWSAAGTAATNWTATPTLIWYDEVGAPPCNGQAWQGYTDLYAYNVNEWAWGRARAFALSNYTYCDQSIFGICIHYTTVYYLDERWDHTYVSGVITLNEFHVPGTPYNELVGDVTHEMGHILGAAHAGCYNGESYYCGNYPYRIYSIMDYLQTYVTTPQPHDVGDINALYP
jgi:hypothetical protein